MKLLEIDAVKKEFSDSRQKKITEAEIFKKIAAKMEECVIENKGKVFKYEAAKKKMFLAIKYANQIAYGLEDTANTEEEARRRVLTYLQSLAIGEIEEEHKKRLRKVIENVSNRAGKARTKRAKSAP
jgi:hypothetical protein